MTQTRSGNTDNIEKQIYTKYIHFGVLSFCNRAV